LTEDQIIFAGNIGIKRSAYNLKRKVKPKYGADYLGWNLSVEGALGEFAVGVAIDEPWNCYPIGDYTAKDVGIYQVRTTRREDLGLRINRSDDPEDIFIGVVGENGIYKIMGWIYGGEGQKPKYWRAPVVGRPNFFVPFEYVHGMSQLPRRKN